MTDTKSWIVRVSSDGKAPFWMGNFYAKSRPEAKREARTFVSQHLGIGLVHILNIAQGSVTVDIQGEVIDMTDDKGEKP